LRVYEKWRPSEAVDFEKIVGREAWRAYWARLEQMDRLVVECQEAAVELGKKIAAVERGVSWSVGLEQEEATHADPSGK
jgi:hypothetical protein